jgi:hypothetical protein
MDAYEQRIPEVAESLHTSLSDVSLSFDGWSSPNGRSLLEIVAHWIDKDCTLRNALIGLPRLEGQNSGEKTAKAVSALIRDYGIQRKIGAFVLDNAANNDTAVEILAQEFGLDPTQCRLRCWGHTVNLVVKALLFGEGLSAFQKELSDAGDDESFDIWRRQHAIGKLHNIVRYIMRSDQRIQMFNEAQWDIADDITTFCYCLVKDTGIRWNSVYNMIARALLLEIPIRSYCRQWRMQDTKAYDPSQDFLFEGNWEELRHYEELLLPFKLAMERLEGKGNKLSLEGSHGALWEVLPAFDFLFMMLKIRADDVSKNPDLFVDHYRHCINHGFEKLKEYYLTGNPTAHDCTVQRSLCTVVTATITLLMRGQKCLALDWRSETRRMRSQHVTTNFSALCARVETARRARIASLQQIHRSRKLTTYMHSSIISSTL